jgi:hypothetical protein
MFCDPSGINKTGTITVKKCFLTGDSFVCDDEGLLKMCEIDTTMTQNVDINYTDCGGGNIDLCPVQPFPACSLK